MNLLAGDPNAAAVIRARRFLAWPENADKILEPLRDLSGSISLTNLREVAEKREEGGTVTLAFASREYLDLSVKWAQAVQKLGIGNFFVVAADEETKRALAALDVATVRCEIDIGEIPKAYHTPLGFSARGVAITALKPAVIRQLLAEGLGVVFSDIDAIWLGNPFPHFPENADVAFQRIVFHPQCIVQQWGFAACTGFMFFRPSLFSRDLVQRWCEWNTHVVCDQFAFNLALLDLDMKWEVLAPYRDAMAETRPPLVRLFATHTGEVIEGSFADGRGRAVALSHDQFWRHRILPSTRQVICHPNSPKSGEEKLSALSDWTSGDRR